MPAWSSSSSSAGENVNATVDAVLAVLDDAWRRIDELTRHDSNNTVLATMLELSRRSRAIDPNDAAFWRTSAASTLLSGLHGERRGD